MPEDSKKNDKKNAKEQRKPRQRHQQGKSEKKVEKVEEPKSAPKVTVPQKPPVYESPPPEFYKNLKRETDEILKITEEENSKYKKKEIQSNWSKYEVPIESYDEIEEQENLGADYEKLIDAPLSVGGHFQFKHEKSWDINTAPSQYDKYFEINMEDLNIALCTIPFHERNNIVEEASFTETDIQTMNNRATRFKQKYYNDKSYSTPEIEAQDKILSSLRDGGKAEGRSPKTSEKSSDDINFNFSNEVSPVPTEPLNTEAKVSIVTDKNQESKSESSNIIEDKPENVSRKLDTLSKPEIPVLDDAEHDDFIFGNTGKSTKTEVKTVETPSVKVVEKPQIEVKKATVSEPKKQLPAEVKVPQVIPTVTAAPVETKPVIESPEDLEKWLDDFLDG